MFLLSVIVAVATASALCWVVYVFAFDKHTSNNIKILAISATILCLILSIVLSQTPQTKLAWINFVASSQKGTWLIIDNSGGETLRHWILYEGYVDGCRQTDGWEFFAESCSPCKIGGDAFVGRISKNQLENDAYKQQFNIPKNQEALH